MSSILGLHEDKLQLTHRCNVCSGCLVSGLHFFYGYFYRMPVRMISTHFKEMTWSPKLAKPEEEGCGGFTFII